MDLAEMTIPPPPSKSFFGQPSRSFAQNPRRCVDSAPMASNPARSPSGAPIVALFLLSGMSGLIYQVVWLRMLIRVFGVTVFAVSTVLVVFMSGLAIGSLGAGRWLRTRPPKLSHYAIAEVLIGVAAYVSTELMNILPSLFGPVVESVGRGTATLALLRFVLAAVVLLPPTVLMGATLPILSGFLTATKDQIGERTGLLYGANTLGAVVGVLATGFVLLMLFGERATIGIGIAINVIVGLVAWALHSRYASAGAYVEESADTTTRAQLNVLWFYAGSGLCALALEVVWSRVLTLVFGSSVYGFSIMLGMYLVGIAVGSLVMGRRADKLQNPVQVFGLLQISVAILAMVSLSVFEALGLVADDPRYLHSQLWTSADFTRLPLYALAIVFPVTFASGAMFPVVVRACAPGGDSTSRTVGKVYGYNTVGSIVGSFSCGFVLIPLLGTHYAFLAVSALSFVLGLGVLMQAHRSQSPSTKPAVIASVLFAVVFATTLRDPFESVMMNRLPEGFESIARIDDGAANVTAVEAPDGTKMLFIDGVLTSGTNYAGRFMQQFPMLLHGEPKTSLIVGLGVGGALRASVDAGADTYVAEINPAVVKLHPTFHPWAEKYLANPRTNIVMEDGRNFLQTTSLRFDTILVDGSPPLFASGTVNLYSKEFLALAHEHLTDDGILTTWLPSVGFEASFWMIIRNFADAFPQIRVWVRRGWDGVIVMGTKSREPMFDVDEATLISRVDALGIKGKDPKMVVAAVVAGGQIINESRAREIAAEHEPVTDDRPHSEFPMLRFLRDEPYYASSEFILRSATSSIAETHYRGGTGPGSVGFRDSRK